MTLAVFLNTIPSIYEGVYHESTGIAGLHYLAFGIGLSGASQINARLLDTIYVYYKKKNGGKGRPEFRLRESSPSISSTTPLMILLLLAPMVPGSWVLPIGLLISGWTARASVHWIAPDIVSSSSPLIVMI